MSSGAHARKRWTRRGVPIALGVLVAVVWAMPALATSATRPGHFRGVVTSRNSSGAALRGRIFRAPAGATIAAASSSNLRYSGGPVMHSDANYAVFWEPGASTTTASYKSTITSYFANVAAASGTTSNDYSVATQYSDGAGAIAYAATAGSPITDTDPYPASGCASTGGRPCLTDAQMETELNALITSHGLPRGLGTIYYIFTPSGVATCFDNTSRDCSSGGKTFDYCAYHSSFGSGSGTTLYAVMPYADVSGCQTGQYPNSNPADQTLNVTSHEDIEAITDPLGNAWYDSSGEEIGDKCGWNFGSPLGGIPGAQYNEQISSGHYELQQEWSNASSGCAQRMSSTGSGPVAAFTFSPTSPTTSQTVSFNGGGSTDTGGTITSYSWAFGDGATGTGVAASHAYSSAGTYTVTLTVRDSAGHTGSVSQSVTVSAASRPVAAFTFSPTSPTAGQSVSFNGAGSTDTGATITSYSWAFGDGATASGVSASHTYLAAGTYTVTLTIRDSAGATNSVSHAVTVSAGSSPVAAFTFAPSSPAPGQVISFNGSGSTDSASITSYSWSFGDGHTAAGATTSHVYKSSTTYTVTLRITDALGRTASVTHTVTVK